MSLTTITTMESQPEATAIETRDLIYDVVMKHLGSDVNKTQIVLMSETDSGSAVSKVDLDRSSNTVKTVTFESTASAEANSLFANLDKLIADQINDVLLPEHRLQTSSESE